MKPPLLILLLGISFLSSCQDKTIEYPLGLVLHGPYNQGDFDAIQESLSMLPSDTLLKYICIEDDVYVAEISNLSEDTFSIFVSKHLGLIWCNYFCFHYLDDDFLSYGGGRPMIIDDIQELDTLLPKSSKRYVTWLQDIKKCDIINISIDVESPYFDSLDSFSPIQYSLEGNFSLEQEHPVFSFQINENRNLVPATQINIQRELDKSIKKRASE